MTIGRIFFHAWIYLCCLFVQFSVMIHTNIIPFQMVLIVTCGITVYSLIKMVVEYLKEKTDVPR